VYHFNSIRQFRKREKCRVWIRIPHKIKLRKTGYVKTGRKNEGRGNWKYGIEVTTLEDIHPFKK
jgi:hypothetical protein